MTRLQSPLDILRLNKHLHFIPGGRYDEFGNLNDWWDAETAQKFADKTQCFVEQYGSVEVKERERERETESQREERERERERIQSSFVFQIQEANIRLNGRLSLGENIADNGGVKTAFNVSHLILMGPHYSAQ